MALNDPFSTTYEGAKQSGESLGQGLQTAAGAIAPQIQRQQQQKQVQQMLKQTGIVDATGNWDTERASKMGLKLNVNTGEASIAPTEKSEIEKLALEQRLQAHQDALIKNQEAEGLALGTKAGIASGIKS